MSDVVRVDKAYIPQVGKKKKKNDTLSLDKLRKHKLAEQPLLPKPFRSWTIFEEEKRDGIQNSM